jgi:hypothetical protein
LPKKFLSSAIEENTRPFLFADAVGQSFIVYEVSYDFVSAFTSPKYDEAVFVSSRYLD